MNVFVCVCTKCGGNVTQPAFPSFGSNAPPTCERCGDVKGFKAEPSPVPASPYAEMLRRLER